MRLAALLALALALPGLPACRPRASFSAGPPAPDVLRFPHAGPGHAGLPCTACHAGADVLAGRPARPGADDHAPCDRSGCHADEFIAPPGPMCGLCHDQVTPWQPGATTLAQFPPRAPARTVPSAFSHVRHLDKARFDNLLGFHVACDDCHTRAAGGDDYDLPGHRTCMRCHADEAAPRIDDCTGCHDDPRAELARSRVLIGDDLHFRHANHEADRAGGAIACASCHRAIASEKRASDRATPPTAACVSCHDDDKRTPAAFSMSQCATCHQGIGGRGLALVAPRSHLPPRDRPDSHTLAFRKDHGADARRDPKACATCHTGLSGRPENCDECHQTMAPSDHLVGWGELNHGREAAIGPERCATCHAGDFCTTCHSQTPRSHLPIASFAFAVPVPGHAAPAATNLRACLTCHDPAADCADAGCHGAGLGL